MDIIMIQHLLVQAASRYDGLCKTAFKTVFIAAECSTVLFLITPHLSP